MAPKPMNGFVDLPTAHITYRVAVPAFGYPDQRARNGIHIPERTGPGRRCSSLAVRDGDSEPLPLRPRAAPPPFTVHDEKG